MFSEGTIWEIKSLKIGLLIFSVFSLYFLFDNYFISSIDGDIEKFLKWGVPLVWIVSAAIGYQILTPTNYPLILFFTILLLHLGFFFFLLGGEIHQYSMTFDERIGQGRWMDVIFRFVPVMAVAALFFSRLWAVVLWLLFSILQPLRDVLLILENTNVYFEHDWNILISDGFAINSWMLRENLTIIVFFVILTIGVFLSNRNLKNSMVNLSERMLYWADIFPLRLKMR